MWCCDGGQAHLGFFFAFFFLKCVWKTAWTETESDARVFVRTTDDTRMTEHQSGELAFVGGHIRALLRLVPSKTFVLDSVTTTDRTETDRKLKKKKKSGGWERERGGGSLSSDCLCSRSQAPPPAGLFRDEVSPKLLAKSLFVVE